MYHKLFWSLCIVGASFLAACQSDPTPAAVDVRIEAHDYARCLRDSLCVEVHIKYPVASSTDAALAQRLTDTLQSLVGALVDVGEPTETAPTQPFKQQMENLGPGLLKSLEADFGQDTSIRTMTYTVGVETKVLLNAPRYLSAEVSSYVYLGGAHGMGNTAYVTLHKSTGRKVTLEEVFSDPKALQPLVERAFLEANKAKGMSEEETTLGNLLLSPEMGLPLPSNFCVVAEGIRMIYNPYEVTAYALGPTEFTLSWEQLGQLANRDKWLK